MHVYTLDAAKVYGWQHLTYIGIYIALFAVSLTVILLKVKSEEKVDLLVKILGGVLLALIIFNRIAIACHRESGWGLVPDSFCGVGSLGLALSCLFFKRGSLPYHIFVYCMLFGGSITVFYPDFIGQEFHGEATSFMYPATISGMMHHSLAFYIVVLLFVTGHFKPCVKKTYVLPIALGFMVTYGVFLLDALDFEKAMYLDSPLIPGTFITWYVVYPALVVAGYGISFLYEYIVKRKSQTNQPATEDNQAENQEESQTENQ